MTSGYLDKPVRTIRQAIWDAAQIEAARMVTRWQSSDRAKIAAMPDDQSRRLLAYALDGMRHCQLRVRSAIIQARKFRDHGEQCARFVDLALADVRAFKTLWSRYNQQRRNMEKFLGQ